MTRTCGGNGTPLGSTTDIAASRCGVRVLSATPEQLPEAVPLDVAATEHGNRWTPAARPHDSFHQRRHRDRTTRLDDELHAIEQEAHRRHERGVVDRHHVVEIALMVREW